MDQAKVQEAEIVKEESKVPTIEVPQAGKPEDVKPVNPPDGGTPPKETVT